jgi:hypothetical protein
LFYGGLPSPKLLVAQPFSARRLFATAQAERAMHRDAAHDEAALKPVAADQAPLALHFREVRSGDAGVGNRREAKADGFVVGLCESHLLVMARAGKESGKLFPSGEPDLLKRYAFDGAVGFDELGNELRSPLALAVPVFAGPEARKRRCAVILP